MQISWYWPDSREDVIILFSCSYPCKSFTMFILCFVTFYLSMNKKDYTFKGQAWACISQAIDNISLQKCRASMTKHRQQVRGKIVRTKETDPIRSQVFSSLTQFRTVNVHFTILWERSNDCSGYFLLKGDDEGLEWNWSTWDWKYSKSKTGHKNVCLWLYFNT